MRMPVSMTRRRVVLVLGSLPLAPLAGAAEDIEEKRTGGPYVPTPQVVVDETLRMGRVGPRDFIVDLGSGDGIIVLTAAQRYKARGLGVDIDPDLVARSNREAKRRGIADLATFAVQDVFKANVGKATVVTLYLLPEMMTSLQSKLYTELKAGTRVVSHDYTFANWEPDDYYTWDVPEKEAVNGVPKATVYVWIVPAKVAGRWQVRLAAPDTRPFELTFKQTFQNIEGTASGSPARNARLTLTRLQGTEITFAFLAGADRYLFTGRVAGDAMEGSVKLPGAKGEAKWTATRVKT